MPKRIGRRLCVALAAALLAAQALAGPTAEQTLLRHRALLSQAEGLNPAESSASAPDDGVAVTAAAGAPPDAAPRLMAPDLPAPNAGLRIAASRCLSDLSDLSDPARKADAASGKPCAARATLSLTAASGGANTMPKVALLDGSALVLALPVGEAYASVQARHWGPGWAGSLILDGAAPPLPAFGWRRPLGRAFETPWLAWLGPWQADAFFGALEGHSKPARPMLVGMRVSMEPLPGVQLGLSRTLQWGGRGRPESLRSLFNALAGRDNEDTKSGQANEPGNQLAGYDLRVALPFGANKPVALYMQAIGEDEAGYLPSKYSALAGADVAWRVQGVSGRAYVELADTLAGRALGTPIPGVTYQHHIYEQGYTHAGAPLGHPIGGDAKLASAGVMADAGPWAATLAVHRGRASALAQSLPPLAALSGLDASLSFDLDRHSRVNLGLWSWRVGNARRDTALQLSWRWGW